MQISGIERDNESGGEESGLVNKLHMNLRFQEENRFISYWRGNRDPPGYNKNENISDDGYSIFTESLCWHKR